MQHEAAGIKNKVNKLSTTTTYVLYNTNLKKVKVKVKCTVVQALRLCTDCTVHRGSRGIGKGKVHRCTGTEALYMPYGP